MGRKKSDRPPGYPRRPHASGQARIRIGGKDVYLGKFGSTASREEYARVVAEWAGAGKPAAPSPAPERITMAELLLRYWRHAENWYVKDGQPTSELRLVQTALAPVKRLYAHTPAAAFGAAQLKAVRAELGKEGRMARTTLNDHVRRVIRAFRWGVEEGLVTAEVLGELRAVRPLQRGRGDLRERKPKEPVAWETLARVLPHVGRRDARTMLELQYLGDMRPEEVRELRADRIDRSRPEWLYEPAGHKSEHRGKTRRIWLGPRAQALLGPLLAARPEGWLFPGQRPEKPLGHTTYWLWLRKACKAAGVPHFAPHQIRHGRSTEVRDKYGAEGAQVMLGHSSLSTTEIYTHRSEELARKIARETG